MAINVVWDDEAKTIIRWDYPAEWTWDDVAAALQRSIGLRRTVTHKVAIILELLKTKEMPPAPFKRFIEGLKQAAQNREMVVFVSEDKFIKNSLEIFLKLPSSQAHDVRLASTLEEAREIIRTAREG